MNTIPKKCLLAVVAASLFCSCVTPEQQAQRQAQHSNAENYTILYAENKAKMEKLPRTENVDLLQLHGDLQQTKAAIVKHQYEVDAGADLLIAVREEIKKRDLISLDKVDLNERMKVGDSPDLLYARLGTPRILSYSETTTGALAVYEYRVAPYFARTTFHITGLRITQIDY